MTSTKQQLSSLIKQKPNKNTSTRNGGKINSKKRQLNQISKSNNNQIDYDQGSIELPSKRRSMSLYCYICALGCTNKTHRCNIIDTFYRIKF